MSKNKRISEEELLAKLVAETSRDGGMTAAAKRLGFSVTYISDVVRGSSPLSPRLAAAMGWPVRRVYYYRPENDENSPNG